MSSNYNRVLKQKYTVPGVCAALAVPAWSASWLMAPHVLVGTGSGFVDFWLGSVSVITGIGAVILTAGSVIAGLCATDELMRE